MALIAMRHAREMTEESASARAGDTREEDLREATAGQHLTRHGAAGGNGKRGASRPFTAVITEPEEVINEGIESEGMHGGSCHDEHKGGAVRTEGAHISGTDSGSSVSAAGMPQSAFKGFELLSRPYEVSSFECKGCPNVCEINRVKVDGEEGYLHYGGRCEKYDVRRARKNALPDLFAFREDALWRAHTRYSERHGEKSAAGRRGTARIGVPYIFSFHDCLPFWSTLLWELGFEVIVSPKTNKQIVTLGLENVLSEACFPVKVAHGHIKHLVDRGVDAVFIPSFININRDGSEYERGEACPYTQTIPYVSRAAIRGMRTITPIVDFSRGEDFLKRQLYSVLRDFRVSRSSLARAMGIAQAAQDRFRQTIEEKSGEVMRSLSQDGDFPVVVIIGRGYNAFDAGVNLEIPRKLAGIDVRSVPMDLLPLGRELLRDSWPNMYWRSGQRILKAARIVRNTPNLFAVYIGNFSCGPDSFILKYFREEMQGKPFLHVEIDEHSADAGAITRCEAFLDSVRQQHCQGITPCRISVPDAEDRRVRITEEPASRGRGAGAGSLKKRTIFIPHMSDHALALKAAFQFCGLSAEMLPESDSESVEIGKRHVSGKECYPYLVTAGDMLKKSFSPDFTPEESMFLMPSGTGPCRFGQYNVSHRLILKHVGLEDVPIFSPNQDVEFYRHLGIIDSDFTMAAWRGIIAFELLTKCLHETRPYENDKGSSDEVYSHYREKICHALKGRNGALDSLLAAVRNDFLAIPRQEGKKPLVGVIGEIFVRSHKFSNENVIRKIEALGGEVWLAPMEEWIYYINAMSLRKALIKRDRSAMMNILLKQFFQKRVEHSYGKRFKGSLRTLSEPATKALLRKASPYVHDSFEGETILSIGKAVDLIERGASGIVNVMPFGCMPGTIVTALLKSLSRDYGVPCISIPFDGTASPTIELQLEAFMESIVNES
jgi:predicted nucleotide-binding protein (sugar kinase/HSP70/actin superfamily)